MTRVGKSLLLRSENRFGFLRNHKLSNSTTSARSLTRTQGNQTPNLSSHYSTSSTDSGTTLSPRKLKTKQKTGAKLAFRSIPILTFLLGVWQYKRLYWKKDLIESVQQYKNKRISEFDISKQYGRFQKVTLTGEYIHDEEVYVMFRRNPSNTQEAGYSIITPFKLSNGQGIVLINRGYVPFKLKDKALRPDSLPRGVVNVGVRVQEGEKGSMMSLNHNLSVREFSFEDVQSIAKFTGSSPLLFDTLPSETPKTGSKLPVGGMTVMTFPDNHFMYMVTWFSTSLFSGLMYLKYIHR